MAAMLATSALGMGWEQRAPEVAVAPWIDTSDRTAVARAYAAAFGAREPVLAWTGRHEGCEAGTSDPSFRSATLDRVNYYRAMAGVPATVAEDAELSAKAQEAAIMMSAEGRLSHEPDPAYACYNPTGAEAAANSNLYLGRNGPTAIDGYIEDPGDDNTDVGHRNTILHPPTRRMGVGDVDRSELGYSANALWVFDSRVFDEGVAGHQSPMREADRFVAWPPRGYIPAPLVHPRWSFTLAGADMSGAEVTKFDPSAAEGEREVPLRVVSRTGAPGHVPLPTVVWEPEVNPSPEQDTDYVIVITGIVPEDVAPAAPVADVHPAYTYTVRIMGNAPSGQLTVSEALALFSGLAA